MTILVEALAWRLLWLGVDDVANDGADSDRNQSKHNIASDLPSWRGPSRAFHVIHSLCYTRSLTFNVTRTRRNNSYPQPTSVASVTLSDHCIIYAHTVLLNYKSLFKDCWMSHSNSVLCLWFGKCLHHGLDVGVCVCVLCWCSVFYFNFSFFYVSM